MKPRSRLVSHWWKVYYYGFFYHNGQIAKAICNIRSPGQDVRYQLLTASNWKSSPTPSEGPQSQKEKEFQKFLQLLEWPEPPNSTSFMSSTSPKTTECTLIDPQTTYHVGELTKVFIRARDHYGNPKTYGGDYFQAKLHSPGLKAGVTGSITDHRNGSYTVTFPLPWPGICQISISLVHSSEAIAILKAKRDTHDFKVYYFGFFYRNGSMARAICNIRPSGQDVCSYRDSNTKEEWFCERPKGFPCSAYLEHSTGGRYADYTSVQQEFLHSSVTDQMISSALPTLNEDKWHSHVCRNQDFPTPANVTSCLKGKIMYMFGDSTLRQWWAYLVMFVPSLQRLDLHVNYPPGPLLATDAEHGYLVQWRAHQRPLFMNRTRLQELRYITNELDNIGGENEGLVVVINCAAHFILFPVNVYLKRIMGIRDAVARLLERSPHTKVIIKSANTGFLPPIGSNWLTWQLDTLLRAVFSGLPVTILDTWQMTSCHRLPQNLHANNIIVKNMVDLMLSFICPK
uniref:NXPE C-terminal domain-containing protein n=1 Tax=Pyxicephalus adspersus TaxID=30357 RepID=A0AAV3AIX9_PYXAD|nr:TPA: hypothetical protein GDO54_011625 [Pyxicephalus adspersus]